MNPSALILMLASYFIVTGVTIYFFLKILRHPGRDEPEPPVKSYDAT